MLKFKWVVNLVLVGLFVTDLSGQHNSEFISPVKHPIVLAGSFGEIRSTHFHAGLDIKPSGQATRDSIFASEMGYISRIKINRSGYGKAVYINHPSGYTTVYAHLHALSDDLESYVWKMQRATESYEIDVYPNPGEMVLQKGGYIGFMGNTGRSYGPHLHFEIRETRTEEPINPMLFGIGPTDSIPPTVKAIMIHSLSKDYDVVDRVSFSAGKLPEKIKAKGWRVGIGLSGYDQMNYAANKNGIYQKSLFVDDTLYYQQTLDRVSFYEMNQIKAHIDYSTKVQEKSTYAMMYTTPANNLMIIDSIFGDGVFPIYASKPRKLKIVCKDLNGNETILKTEVWRDTQMSELKPEHYDLLAKYDRENKITHGEVSLTIPQGALEKDEKITIRIDSSSLGKAYYIGDRHIPLLLNAKVNISIPNAFSNSNKVLLVNVDDGKFIDYGTTIHKDIVSSYIGSFGKYQLIQDTIPPYLSVVSGYFNGSELIAVEAHDNVEIKGSAIDFTYDTYVNGVWTPFEYKSLDKKIYIAVSDLKKGDQIKIVAKDQLQNVSELDFIY